MDERILVWASPRDARLTCDFLEDEGFRCCPVLSWEELGREWPRGGAALVIAGELLTQTTVAALEQLVAVQPQWSDPPVIIVGSEHSTIGVERFAALGNVSLLRRPLSLDTLRSTVQAALRARRRQYEVRNLLRQKDDADRRKDEFLAMLAHELRNPMAPLRTGLQLLQMTTTPEVVNRTHEMMQRQITHLSRLIDDLLDVSRIARGNITLSKEPLDIREPITNAVDAIRPQAGLKGLDLDVTLPPEPVVVDADHVRIEQMVGNLLSNALKFTPDGGVIGVSVSRAGSDVTIRVCDTGAGIPPEHLDHVFDLFAQSPRSIDRGLGGLGIGLTVVKLLAEQHGGLAEIFSRGENTGTEAIIHLPLSDRGAAASTPAAAAPAVAPCPRRVLIIEDNQDAADMLAAFLAHLGHDVTIANDGAAGLEIALSRRFDVIVCDVGLPQIDGYEIAARLKQQWGRDGCLLVAMTGYGGVVDRERTRQAGFAHHLTKPADPRQVAQLVASASA